ncbi:class I SAM-dependent methyltransferase [Mycobacterium sp. ITM-2016-00318]|uniref:class I SAM-dependent methyltransferase n=1 Tax=Mycobacterium sp. ITM-2016-00318 TaxID=2099693 RepID=UPI000CF963E9|nr:methyltransferase domain-containing protein [Mycobacterium sp. ITM-2016-00318]WNG94595.1 methyltransferase domain-containing protein [Mycobacterium sp. ITM-2016-00318]
MTGQPTTVDQAVIAKHRAMWATGDYPKMAIDLVSPLGPVLVEATQIGPGDRVLDVAAGTGNAAIRAAQAGADVVASDLCPELLAAGAAAAAELGVELQWREADAHALPFGDNEFDVVMSCIGVMFAPFHEQSAGELARVCKPGGRIGLLSWTPEGHIGQLFGTMKPYMPPPPLGAQPPPLWGSEDHVRALFGDRVTDVVTERQMLAVNLFADGAAFRDYFKHAYGPTIAAYRNIEGAADRISALDSDIARIGDGFFDGGDTMQWEYLLLTARKA